MTFTLPARARLVVGYAAILGTVPYLLLKAAWLTGSTVGIADLSLAGDTSLFVLNTVTAGMDVVAVVVALAFTHRWGLRLPAWLVIGPMWVGTGLLAPIAVGTPIVATGMLVAGGETTVRVGATPFLEPWVQPMVYAGFAWQGVTLVVAFVLYARVRWASLFTTRTVPLGATHQVRVVLATGGTVLAGLAATYHLAHAAGGSIGLPAGPRAVSAYLVEGVNGALALVAAVGVLLLVHRVGRRPWVPLAMTWTGSGVLFAWGLWGLVNTLGGTFLAGDGPEPVAQLADLVKVLAGLVIGLTGLVTVAEWWSVARLGGLVVERGHQPDEEHDRHERDDQDLYPHAVLR